MKERRITDHDRFEAWRRAAYEQLSRIRNDLRRATERTDAEMLALYQPGAYDRWKAQR